MCQSGVLISLVVKNGTRTILRGYLSLALFPFPLLSCKKATDAIGLYLHQNIRVRTEINFDLYVLDLLLLVSRDHEEAASISYTKCWKECELSKGVSDWFLRCGLSA